MNRIILCVRCGGNGGYRDEANAWIDCSICGGKGGESITMRAIQDAASVGVEIGVIEGTAPNTRAPSEVSALPVKNPDS